LLKGSPKYNRENVLIQCNNSEYDPAAITGSVKSAEPASAADVGGPCRRITVIADNPLQLKAL